MGGFTAHKSYITALSWAALPHQPPQEPPVQPHSQALPHGRDQLLLFSGSSDGSVRLHTQSVETLGAAQMQLQGQLLEGNLMPLSKTLQAADLLGVTCLAIKRARNVQTGVIASSDVQTHCPEHFKRECPCMPSNFISPLPVRQARERYMHGIVLAVLATCHLSR